MPTKFETNKPIKEKQENIESKNIETQNTNSENIVCTKCNVEKPKVDFLPCFSKNNTSGFTTVCKDCCVKFGLIKKKFTRKAAYGLCKLIDKPYKEEYYLETDKKEYSEEQKVLVYIQTANLNKGNRRSEDFSMSEEINENAKSNAEIENIRKESTLLFGDGFTDKEYQEMYETYNDYSNNYTIRTTMHKKALVKVCKIELRFNKAVAVGDTNDAKYWGDLLSKAQNEAKINPSQLSAADLSDGMTSFSQVSAAIEKAVDIISLLPKYRQEPQDAVDYTLWQYINYGMALENKPEVTYAEIYKFLDKKYEQNKNKFTFIVREENKNADEYDFDKNIDAENGEN